MEVRVYRAKEMKDILAQIKRDLGENAIILSTRKIGAGGLLGTPMLEVRATDDNSVLPTSHSSVSHSSEFYGPVGVLPIFVKGESESAQNASVERRAGRTERSLAGIGGNIRRRLEESNREAGRHEWSLPPHMTLEPREREIYEKFMEILSKKGVRETEARLMAAALAPDIPPNVPVTAKALKRFIIQALAARVNTTGPIMRSGRRKIIALVGPTGSGKTTTAAKIAAYESLVKGWKVALISADNFRVAASEQLSKYADLIGIPFAIANTRKEMSLAVRKLAGSDLIIIDTAGRNYMDDRAIERLGALLGSIGSVEVHLVLPAVTREAELEAVIDAQQYLRPSRLIVTKVDEALTHGVIFNVQQYSELPISVIGNGQRVPEDLLIPEPQDIAELIIERRI